MPPRRTWTKCTRTPSTSATEVLDARSAHARRRASRTRRAQYATSSRRYAEVGALRPRLAGRRARPARPPQPRRRSSSTASSTSIENGSTCIGGTLREVLGPSSAPTCKVLFVGINPSLRSAEVGHHFARPGNRFYPALHAAGFTPRRLRPDEDGTLPALRRRHHEHRRPPDARRRRALARGAARGRARARRARRAASSRAWSRSSASAPTAPRSRARRRRWACRRRRSAAARSGSSRTRAASTPTTSPPTSPASTPRRA